MAVMNYRKYVTEADTKAIAYSKDKAPVMESRMAFRTGSMLAVLFVAVMQSAYGDEHSNAPHSSAPQSTPAASLSTATKSPGSMGFGSLTAGAENAPKIVWEPIGKYSQKEINLVSDTVGELFSHMKKMEAIESSVTPLVRNGSPAGDKDAAMRTATNYGAEAQEESKKIDQFKIPAIKNRQAAEMLAAAKAGLKNASEIQKDRASKVAKMVSGSGDSKALSGEIQQLGSQRIAAAFQFVNAYKAYESYGFTSDQIDLSTGRLKKDAKPDRLEPEPQAAKKNTP